MEFDIDSQKIVPSKKLILGELPHFSFEKGKTMNHYQNT